LSEREIAIEVTDLSKKYRQGPLANDGISLTVHAGELFSLLGPNGAGKTTLVSQITGELMPTSGSISVFGIDVVRHPRHARQTLGIVPQEAGLFYHVTVTEHLTSFGRMRGLSGRALKERVAEMIDDLNLAEHADKRANQLSGGLKRKLLVAIALIGRPRALILDEPTTGLDPHSRREVWEMIRRYQRDGAAVLLTTHYMDEAEYLAERVGIVSRGRLVVEGTVPELHARISNRFKLTYVPADSDYGGGRTTEYAPTMEEIQARVATLGLEEYDIAKTNLEDIYLELTSESLAGEVADV
jgi:ABC-2 type transport system ATP-binding protein